MLIALEGSSPTIFGENNYKYYVWQFKEKSRETPKLYVKGPAAASVSDSPVNIRKMANEATAFVRANGGKVFLLGWSRGAAACIQVAHDLKRDGSKKVDAMFLFDAVDRDTSTNSDLNFIPDNVINVYHAIATDKNLATRHIFKTCGRVAAAGVKLNEKLCDATHGGVAGNSDDDGAGKWVKGSIHDGGSGFWMLSNMQKEGVM